MTSPHDEPQLAPAAQARMYGEAEADLRRVLRLHRSHAPAVFEGGLNEAADLAGAYAALERALQVDPADAESDHLIGPVLDRMSRPEEARAMYRRCRELTTT